MTGVFAQGWTGAARGTAGLGNVVDGHGTVDPMLRSAEDGGRGRTGQGKEGGQGKVRRT